MFGFLEICFFTFSESSGDGADGEVSFSTFCSFSCFDSIEFLRTEANTPPKLVNLFINYNVMMSGHL